MAQTIQLAQQHVLKDEEGSYQGLMHRKSGGIGTGAQKGKGKDQARQVIGSVE